MSSISQTIPYYIQGISEQPDQLKKSGQVRDSVNALPDVTDGLVKRPAGEFLSVLAGTKVDGSGNDLQPIIKNASGAKIDTNVEAAWFPVDQPEKYIGRVHTDGKIHMWKAANGTPIVVDDFTQVLQAGGCGCTGDHYLKHTDPESLKFLTINDHTFIVNREKTVSLLATDDCRYGHPPKPFNNTFKNPNHGRPYEAFIELKNANYKTEYPLDISSTAAAGTGTTNTTVTKLKATWVDYFGNPQNMDVRNVGSTKYTYTKTFTINPSPQTGNYTGTSSHQRNLRFRLKMTGMPYSENDKYHSVYRLEWDLLHGGYGWKVGDHFQVSMGDTGSTGYYKVQVLETDTWKSTADIGIIRPCPTSSSADQIVTADSILETLIDEIILKCPSNYFVITKIGNGIHLRANYGSPGSGCRTWSKFNITTTKNDNLNIITNEVSDVSKLPRFCADGYLVKVVNSKEDDDDHWLKFVSDTSGKGGAGHWQETYDPCLPNIDFNPCSMPHKLVKINSNKFELKTIDWEPRRVGDENTNPEPSFVGSTINNLLFFRNRLAFLTDESVFFSQAGDYYNLWVESAMAVADGDPIDVSTSSTRPVTLYDGIEVNQGLLVFSPYEQFMVTTDVDAFAPGTAKINNLSAFDYNIGIKPFSLGDSIGFTSNSGSKGRMWSMSKITRDQAPTVVEQSKTVANSLPSNLLTAASSRDNNLVLFSGWDGNPGTSYAPCPDPYNTVWGYRYYSDGQKLVQSAWFKWDMYGKVLWHVIMDNTYYAVVHFNDESHFLAFDLERQSATNTINDTNVCEHHYVYLDNAVPVEFIQYDATTNKTNFLLPFSHKRQPSTHGQVSGGSQVVYGTSGAKKGQVEIVEAFTANSVGMGYIQGDWSSTGGYLGFTYDMKIEFPTPYLNKPDGSIDIASNLTLHRAKFSLGPSGYYSSVLERKGRADYIEDYNSSSTHTFDLNAYNILLDSEISIPIYASNKDYKLSLRATHPTPLTIYSQTWEGDYNTNYYQRA